MRAVTLFLSVCVLVVLSGCVMPIPFRSYRSPELSGRILDGRSKAPLPGATVSFLQDDLRSPLEEPRATADGEGRFHLRASHNYHAAGGFFGHDNVKMWPNGPRAEYLLIERAGYSKKTIDLHVAFRASGLVNPEESIGLRLYRGLVPLGDITLKK